MTTGRTGSGLKLLLSSEFESDNSSSTGKVASHLQPVAQYPIFSYAQCHPVKESCIHRWTHLNLHDQPLSVPSVPAGDPFQLRGICNSTISYPREDAPRKKTHVALSVGSGPSSRVFQDLEYKNSLIEGHILNCHIPFRPQTPCPPEEEHK